MYDRTFTSSVQVPHACILGLFVACALVSVHFHSFQLSAAAAVAGNLPRLVPSCERLERRDNALFVEHLIFFEFYHEHGWACELQFAE